MARLTIGEAAALLERVELDLPAEYFSRQLRVYAARGLLGHLEYRGHGRTAAALLGEREVCVARLLSVMSRLGLRQEQIHGATRCLDNVVSDHPAGGKPESHRRGLLGVLDGIAAGEPWFFVLKVGPWTRGADPAVGDVRGGFYQVPDFGRPDISYLGAVVLPCGDLFAPLLRHMRGLPPGSDPDDDAPASRTRGAPRP